MCNILENYDTIDHSKHLVRALNSEFTSVKLANCKFDLFGGILKSERNLDFEFVNNFFNMDKLSHGFDMQLISCNHPGA